MCVYVGLGGYGRWGWGPNFSAGIDILMQRDSGILDSAMVIVFSTSNNYH